MMLLTGEWSVEKRQTSGTFTETESVVCPEAASPYQKSVDKGDPKISPMNILHSVYVPTVPVMDTRFCSQG